MRTRKDRGMEMVDELLGTIHEINELSKTAKDLAKALQADYKSTKALVTKKTIPPSKIVQIVMEEFGVDFTRRTRKFKYAEARHTACYLFRRYTFLPLRDIAEYTGTGDHTTVIHAIKKVEDVMDVDSTYADRVAKLEEKMKAYYEQMQQKNDNNI